MLSPTSTPMTALPERKRHGSVCSLLSRKRRSAGNPLQGPWQMRPSLQLLPPQIPPHQSALPHCQPALHQLNCMSQPLGPTQTQPPQWRNQTCRLHPHFQSQLNHFPLPQHKRRSTLTGTMTPTLNLESKASPFCKKRATASNIG